MSERRFSAERKKSVCTEGEKVGRGNNLVTL